MRGSRPAQPSTSILKNLVQPTKAKRTDSTFEQPFLEHLLKLLAGHQKLGTRILHLATTHVSVAALLCAASTVLPVPLLLALLWLRYFSTACGRFGLATLSTFWLAAVLGILQQWIPDSSALMRAAGSVLVFVGSGLIEQLSHWCFGDSDVQLVTHGRAGWDRVVHVAADVILDGPLSFCCLLLLQAELIPGFPSFETMLPEAERLRTTTLNTGQLSTTRKRSNDVKAGLSESPIESTPMY
eukprot:TRINITY_DN34407_c0_g1_i1.p1 TRINITY_DN34407_c0_g1~~TRINITY_DN34407_c0_g1_i1.p1  ORF type:complete len:241 (-),score=37.98 TRINITY_DN34407_c0_g1_i1:8-730(-)